MKKSVCIICILFLIAFSLSALDLGGMNYEVVSSRTEEGQDIYEIIDPYGHPLTLVGTQYLTDASVQALKVMLSTFNSWDNLDIETQRAVITEKRTEIAIVPESFSYGGMDLAEYMPSGMQFYYTSFLEYDFRLFTKNLFLRVTGQLFDEEQFCNKLLKALENPILYIQTHNPDYLIEQLALLTVEMDNLSGALDSYKKDNDRLASDFKALKADYDEETGALKTENELLRNAVMAFSNGNLFKLTDPLSQETIDAVLEAKRANPDMPQKELAALLKEQGTTVSAKAVSIIYAVFFNEF